MRNHSLKFAASAVAAIAFLSAPALAGTNLGFEQGDTSGWTLDGGNAGVSESWAPSQGDSPTFKPKDGIFFGFVTAGADTDYAILSQTFQLVAGGTITGYAGFANLDGYFADENQFFNDKGFVAVNGDTLLDWTGLAVGGFANSGWYQFTFTAPDAGDYTLQFGVANDIDGSWSSSVVFDRIRITGQVPEAATWAMMLAGFGLVGSALRSRRRTVSFG